RRKERKRLPPTQGRPSLTIVAPVESPEPARPAQAVPRASSVPSATARAPARHIGRDYSYVLGEVRRIAIIMAIVIAGLIAMAIILR
ncbi:MAG: hypothetical protein Q8P22_08780, partial [Chloroflexota bacterium]|nr:hypothetical protein [Chloroflexota bacterium]